MAGAGPGRSGDCCGVGTLVHWLGAISAPICSRDGTADARALPHDLRMLIAPAFSARGDIFRLTGLRELSSSRPSRCPPSLVPVGIGPTFAHPALRVVFPSSALRPLGPQISNSREPTNPKRGGSVGIVYSVRLEIQPLDTSFVTSIVVTGKMQMSENVLV